MPTPAFMSVTGAKQGNISANAGTEASIGLKAVKGHEDQILVQAIQHDLNVPRDPQTGQATGQRVHMPFIVTKCVDASSPLLFTALTLGENITKIVIDYMKTNSNGAQVNYFTVTLENAIIVDMKSYMPNCLDPACSHFTNMEDVSFTYGKILWDFKGDGITAISTSGADDWRNPIV